MRNDAARQRDYWPARLNCSGGSRVIITEISRTRNDLKDYFPTSLQFREEPQDEAPRSQIEERETGPPCVVIDREVWQTMSAKLVRT